ncbi:MAG TPA: ribonuclease III [Limnochordia bacterium]|nr:ribonuclease III [Limnochordia bacterium]
MERELIQAVEEKLGYIFQDPRLLELALTHRSVAHEPRSNNERLEFLGDAVLQLTVSTYLYRRFPDMPEGELAKVRSLLVRESTLASIARELELDRYLQVGEGEKRSGAQQRDSLLCDVVEAVYGAIYLDGGFAQAEQVILRHLPAWDAEEIALLDAKSTLQEYFQQRAKKLPMYTLVQETGPDHDKRFVVEVHFEGERLGTGSGTTKKEAEQEAARAALARLGIQ